MKNQTHHPHGYRLYGRQKSRPLTAAQQELLDQVLPNIDVDIQEISKTKEAVLEIGFGGGEHLVDKAAHNKDALHIGCEPFVNGVVSLLTHLDDANLSNVRIHHGDVRHLYAELPDASFDAIYLLYPDPWPKKRHWKRRFIQNETFVEMKRLLKPKGHWFIATDHPCYQEWIDQRLLELPATNNFKHVNKDMTHQPWDGFKTTRYQEKALREGRVPKYYVLQSTS